MRKLRLKLCIRKIVFLSGKGKTVWKLNQMLYYSGAGQLFIYHFCLKIAFERRFSVKKTPSFFYRIKYISRFLCLNQGWSVNACLVRCMIRKQCICQQNVVNILEAKRVDLQSKPWIIFADTLQPSWPLRPKINVTLLFYFLKLYNFGLNAIFVGSTSSELQHPWNSKITTEPKKSRKKSFFRLNFEVLLINRFLWNSWI